MSDRGNQILQEVLSLPPEERAELVELVLASFDTASRRDVDSAWATEAEDRVDAYERGDIPTVTAAEVFGKLRGRRNG